MKNVPFSSYQYIFYYGAENLASKVAEKAHRLPCCKSIKAAANC